MRHITEFPFKKTIYKYLYPTCWKHHVQSGGTCFSLLNLPFTGKCTAQVFLSKLGAWGKLRLALSVGDTRAQSAITNNYCTEGRGGASAWKTAHMLARLNVKVIEWGLLNNEDERGLLLIHCCLFMSPFRSVPHLCVPSFLCASTSITLWQQHCTVSKEMLNPPPSLSLRACAALRWTNCGWHWERHCVVHVVVWWPILIKQMAAICDFCYKSSPKTHLSAQDKRLFTNMIEWNASNYTCQISFCQ